ncbi:MAG: hypothetical protein WC223_10960 [Bacteroidales bacterium]|jgi:hypothetical protein
MRKLIVYLAIAFVAISFISCEDIIEPNLAKKSITLIAPSNNTSTSNTGQTFMWEKVKGAEQYNLQIATPTFAQVNKFVLDTNVTGTKCNYNLTPGAYQWRVKAFNNNSNTEYVTYSIIIDSTLNLTNVTVILNSPKDTFAINSTTYPTWPFTWYTLYNATKYLFELRYQGTTIFSTIRYTGDYTFDISSYNEGWYDWAVQAQNDNSLSKYSTRKLIIDKTIPGTPTLILPANNHTFADSLDITLQWNRVTDSGSPIKDSVYIYSDSLFVNKVSGNYTSTTSLLVSASTLSTGNYFWRVKSIDGASNKSNFSSSRKFIIN